MSRIQTVRGMIDASDIRRALAHEHIFVDFHPTDHPAYMNIDWGSVRGAGLNRLRELHSQGIDLLVDWTAPGVGRNAALLRDISAASGVSIICPTGVYLAKRPPAWQDLSVADLAGRFIAELTAGIDGTTIRAGFIKIATSDDGPTDAETAIHRAAAIAAREAGAAIGLHSPFAGPLAAVCTTLSAESFPLDRLIWAHAQRSTPDDHARFAAQGLFVQFDSFQRRPAPGESPDAILDAIDRLVAAGHGGQVLVSADASVAVNPFTAQYGYDATAIMRHIRPRLRERLGDRAARAILRDNVLSAFAWPEQSPVEGM